MIPILFTPNENDPDKRKCAELYEKYKGLMMHIALGKTNDHALAEDMVSEAAVKMIRHVDKIYPLESYPQQEYIASIVRTTCIDYFRKANKHVTESVDALKEDFNYMVKDGGATNPLETLVNSDGYEAIVAAIMELPETLKNVAYLFFVLERDHSEISELLNISYGNSKQRLSRAKAVLKKKLGK
ncbi:MAG: sigma-70 family RNA polymerase sigma factor [Defluviitaleaceae bacterium]|nr:sigma-70 family RNA polymerase sigma factor [Defluviitaleaceae bacterium]